MKKSDRPRTTGSGISIKVRVSAMESTTQGIAAYVATLNDFRRT